MPKRTYSYGLKTATGALLGVAVFGYTISPESRDICGRENRSLAICLERGACVPDAPDHAASFLISRAVKLAAADKGWRIFYAYSDPEAGEVGTVYQATNWLYLGTSKPRVDWLLPDGERITERTQRRRGLNTEQTRAAGWQQIERAPRHKYVTLVGDRRERRALLAALRIVPQPYPDDGA